jgi:hypothetical protein
MPDGSVIENVAVHGEASLQAQLTVATVDPRAVSSAICGATGLIVAVSVVCRVIACRLHAEDAHTASAHPISHLAPFHRAVRNAM